MQCHLTSRAASGNYGENGLDNFPPSINGEIGAKGEFDITELSYDDQLSKYSYSFVRMLLHEAEIDYLNGEIKIAAEKLLWLSDLVESGKSLARESVDLVQNSEDQFDESEERVAVLMRRINILLIQLSQGVDYYGHYPNFVPLTSVSVYENSIDGMLDLATDIEKAYNDYVDKEQDDLTKKAAIRIAIDNLESKQDIISSQSVQSKDEVSETRKQVVLLLEEEIILESKVNDAKREFQDAVSREAACGFEDVTKAAIAIAAIYTGVGAVAGGMAALGEMQGMIDKKEIKDTFKDQASYFVKEFKVINGGIDKIKNGYASVKETLERERDGAKLIMAEGNFEEAVKKFYHLKEAKAYLALMRQYLGVIKTRNNKILEIDTKITRLLELESENDQIQTEISEVEGRLVQVFNPVLAEYVVFFERAVTRIKSDILKAIVMEFKSLQYWGLKNNLVPKNLKDRSIGQLKVFHISFKSKLLDLIVQRNGVPQDISPEPRIFQRSEMRQEFDVFDKTGRLTFTMSPDDPKFKYYSRVLMKNVKVKFIFTRRLLDSTFVLLRHHGNPTFIDKSGNEFNFSHRSRNSFDTLKKGTNEVSLHLLGNGEDYYFLSPFATWTFSMDFSFGSASDLTEEKSLRERKKLSKISMYFEGVADYKYNIE
ncbi:hypothetical protein Q4534_06385 [Cyclobacterium sp. 1_MG-2023]|uniref:hypothetical protein n=1 Tax=Cyclobacterium sp. 1_MG-2023 TaxID=3062681 RepID=UPI0026E30B19|nr:hypothetical protein [Cyclobacterium sp. 1_MG-2023]MDO6437023.1 hypothetical protein [Cyclobacterium sp. 1_MG-2023]